MRTYQPVELLISDVQFECVRLADADFSDFAAVYVVICVGPGGRWSVLDVGQSGQVGTRIDGHDRQSDWLKNCPSGNIWVCVHRMPSTIYSKQDRLDLEAKLRDAHDPPCGER